jgi:hypothetical protein
MISPEDSCLSPGVYGAFAISEAFLYRTKVPECELYAFNQFQEWMKRQNGNAVMTDAPRVEEPDSPDKMSKDFSFEDPGFFDDSEVSFVFIVAKYLPHSP